MKYRPLHKEELESLQDDFVKFLASNSVTASDWTELKSNDPSKAEQLIGVFSEIVWEKVLGNIKFMRHRFASEMRVYKFDEESATAVVLRLGKSGVDFTDADDVKKLAAGKLDVVLESDINILDIAALSVIVRAAGGQVTDLEGRPLGLDTTSVLASNGRLHARVLDALHR